MFIELTDSLDGRVFLLNLTGVGTVEAPRTGQGGMVIMENGRQLHVLESLQYITSMIKEQGMLALPKNM